MAVGGSGDAGPGPPRRPRRRVGGPRRRRAPSRRAARRPSDARDARRTAPRERGRRPRRAGRGPLSSGRQPDLGDRDEPLPGPPRERRRAHGSRAVRGEPLELAPDTTYDIELHATDPDGPVDQTLTTQATTRPPPGDPAHPTVRPVSDAAGLQAALDAAQPGDVITLAEGLYRGSFSLAASGTAV